MNRQLARLLFNAFDSGGNGTIARSEFINRWRTLAEGSVEDRHAIVFELFDVKQQVRILQILRIFNSI
eukprot:COSAG04_NODE_593_length_12275_cov_8.681915_9_plen_68_part_00